MWNVLSETSPPMNFARTKHQPIFQDSIVYPRWKNYEFQELNLINFNHEPSTYLLILQIIFYCIAPIEFPHEEDSSGGKDPFNEFGLSTAKKSIILINHPLILLVAKSQVIHI